MAEAVIAFAEFWRLLATRNTPPGLLRRACERVLCVKREIKLLFASLKALIQPNIELFTLEHLYHCQLLCEPIEAKLFDKRVAALKQQIALEASREAYIYPLDRSALALRVSLRAETAGQVIWASKNTSELLEIDEKLIRSLHINALMPRVVAEIHDPLVKQYLLTGRSNIVNAYRELWAVTHRRRLFSSRMCLKLLLEDSGLCLAAFIRRTADRPPVFLSSRGELDCFGRTFAELSGLSHDFSASHPGVPIFLFMPALLASFLGNFYDLPTFRLQDFDYEILEDTFFLLPRDAQARALDLAKALRPLLSDREAYASELYRRLSTLRFPDVERVFRVRAKLTPFIFEKAGVTLRFWELRLLGHTDVTPMFTEAHFLQQMCFLQKIHFDDSLRVSIEKYTHRLSEQQEAHALTPVDPYARKETTGEDFEAGNDTDIVHKSTLTDYKKKNSVANRPDADLEAHKAVAIGIIRKLFAKNFNPGNGNGNGEGSENSPRQRWVGAVNSYNQKRNSIISTIVERHIGKLIRKPAPEFQH